MSALEIFTCEQNSAEWLHARLGVITASEFDSVLAKGQGKTRAKYMRTLAGQIITGKIEDGFSNSHTERGHELEPEARNFYAFMRDVEPQLIGFMKRGRVGASPDAMIGDDGLLEIKTKLQHLQVECLIDDKLPAEHRAQVQGQLWVSGREWVDFVSYCPGLPLFVKRVTRDERYIAELKVAVDDFITDLDQMVAKLQQYKAAA
jgi:predicted phage-related endonuclease